MVSMKGLLPKMWEVVDFQQWIRYLADDIMQQTAPKTINLKLGKILIPAHNKAIESPRLTSIRTSWTGEVPYHCYINAFSFGYEVLFICNPVICSMKQIIKNMIVYLTFITAF